MSIYQVKLSLTGPWHRRETGNGGDHTACGLPIDGAYLSREHVLDEQLCSVCFTHRELDTGKMKRIEKEALDSKRADALLDHWAGRDSDDEITDEHEPTGEHSVAHSVTHSAQRAPLSREESGEIDTNERTDKRGKGRS